MSMTSEGRDAATPRRRCIATTVALAVAAALLTLPPGVTPLGPSPAAAQSTSPTLPTEPALPTEPTLPTEWSGGKSSSPPPAPPKEAPEADEADDEGAPCDETFTYWDGDAERTVALCDELPDDGDSGDPDDVRRRRGDLSGTVCAPGASDEDALLFRAESGVDMTLEHSVVLVLDPYWDDARVRRFLARNRIPQTCVSPLGWIANGFAVATGPGIAALVLANQLAPEHGVVLSSPNWASEFEVKTESGPPTRLSAPTITAVYPSDRSITVAWEPPSDAPDGVDVTYDIAWIASDQADDPAAEWNTVSGVAGSETEVVIWDSLSNGTTYDVRIRAVAEQDGEWSEAVSAEPFERPAAPSDDAPAIPLDVTIGSVLDDTGHDVDLFKIEMDEPHRLTMRTIGGEAPFVRDTMCRLLDQDGTLVPNTENDDIMLSKHDQQCSVHANLASGTYYFEVRGYAVGGHPARGENRGRFSVRATTAPNPGTTADTALPLPQDTIFAGSFASREETQFWRLDAAASPRDWVKVFVTPLVGEIDVSLRDSSGERLDVDSRPLVACYLTGCVHKGVRFRTELSPGAPIYAVVEPQSDHAVYALERTLDQETWRLMSLCRSLERSPGISDELQGCQWHLDNRAQRGGVRGEDANVVAAHAAGHVGAGVGVAVVDTGIDLDHDDLAGNTDISRSRSYCGSDTAPFSGWGDHGTAVAGVIAARDNDIGMRGVAPRATVFNRRLICDSVSAEDMADAMTRDMASICVSNNSWAHSDGADASPVSRLFDLAIDQGVSSGCGGKGISYVWAAGNGARVLDDSNLDELANYYGVMSVCAVNARGQRSVYSEQGANLWVCGPSNDRRDGVPGVATTTNHDRYRLNSGGTSSAAPMVAGTAALVRGANSELTWRDVKLILAASARQNQPGDSSWRQGAVKWGETGERYRHSREYGFGVVDAHAAVQLAEEWTNLPPMITQTQTSDDDAFEIPDGSGSISKSVTFDDAIEFVEFVQIDTSFKTWHFRDLQIELVSPSGTEVLVVPAGPAWLNYRNTPLNEPFRFGVAGLLGEPAEGTWTLRITDTISGGPASLKGWGITLYGHRLRPAAPTLAEVVAGQGSLAVSWSAPPYPGASDLTGYELRHIAADATDRADSDWAVVTVPGGAGAVGYTIESLLPAARDVQVRAVSGEIAGAWSAAMSVTPRPVSNTEPEFAADSVTLQVAENSAGGAAVGEPVVAVDGDEGAELAYSLGGTDAAGFSIDSATGQISVSSAFDFEAPADSDGDNVYELSVWVSDGRGDEGVVDASVDDSVAVSVEVVDVDEPLVLAVGDCDFVVADSDSGDWECTLEASDPEGAEVVWSLSGDDAALFGIDGGVLSLVEAADADAAGDADGDGVYEVTVEAAAGGHSASASVSLAVSTSNRAPVFGGTPERTNNAPPGFLVSLTLFQADFTDPDGDALTFEISTSRDDVVAPDGITHVERFGRLFFVAKTACALLELGPTAGEVYETAVTMTATDPDGATATATRIFRTDPTWNTSTASLEDVCPQAAGATVDGATLVISLDGALAMSIEPPTPAEFAVTADGAAVGVASVRRPVRDDTTITLELASPVEAGQAVTVSYAPGGYPIAYAFADHSVTNNTQPPPEPPAPVCTTAPEGVTAPTCAAVSGNDLIVTFSADLANLDAAAAGALRFSIFVDGAFHNGSPVNSQSPGRITTNGTTLTLTLGTAVRAGDEVTIHYSAPSTGNGLNDTNGTPIPSFTLTVTTT